MKKIILIFLLFIFSKISYAKECELDGIQFITQEKCHLEFSNGSIEVNGQFEKGMLNGFAEFYTPEGTENYIGSFINNIYHGYGLLIFDDASKHLGSWKNGYFRQGIIDYPEAVYTATLDEEEITSGTAAFLFENLEVVYVGEVQSSKFDGEGIRYVLKNVPEREITEGVFQIGLFKDNIFETDYSTELPECEYDLKIGIVTTTDKCFGNEILNEFGMELTGVFENQELKLGIIKKSDFLRIGRFNLFELDGNGFISSGVDNENTGYIDNAYYIGEFVEGRLTGYGHYNTKDDLQKYYGEFVNFSKSGFGSEINFANDPFEFHGIFKDNEFHGYGLLYAVASNGELETTTGFYQNGEYIHDDKDIVYDNWSNEFNKRHK